MRRLSDLVISYKSINKQIDNIKQYIKENNKDRIKSIFESSTEARKKDFYGQILRNEKKNNINLLRDVHGKIDQFCSFKFGALTSFICNVISILEGEVYVKTYYTFSNNRELRFLGLDDTEEICLIASPENIELINLLKRQRKVKSGLDIFDVLGNDRFILIDKDKTYNVFDYEKLDIKKELFICFPYLRDIINIVVNMKINNNISDIDIFNRIEDSLSKSITMFTDEDKENETIFRK